MTASAIACTTILVATVSGDLFVADARAVEVWLGFELRGPLALVTAPIHWTIFAIFTWAFWQNRSWVVPWAAGYVFYAAVSHVVWSEASPHGRGWRVGLLQGLALAAVAILLLRAGRSSSTAAGVDVRADG
jgi:hypothetical protein